MSNSYAHFYTKIPYWTGEQRNWLLCEMKHPDEIERARRAGGLDWGCCADSVDSWDFPINRYCDPVESDTPNPRKVLGHLVLEGEQSSDDVAFLVLVYSQKFHLFYDEPWIMEVAYTCDRPDETSFGGCGYSIYKGQTYFVSTQSALIDWTESIDAKEEEKDALLTLNNQ